MGLKTETRKDMPTLDQADDQKELLETVRELQARISRLETRLSEMKTSRPVASGSVMESKSDIAGLLMLPDHLRKTMIALGELEQATASQVSDRTGRVRNLESSYLNQLERMELIEKLRDGIRVYFNVKKIDKAVIQGRLEELKGEEKIDEEMADEIAQIYNLPKTKVPKWLVKKRV